MRKIISHHIPFLQFLSDPGGGGFLQGIPSCGALAWILGVESFVSHSSLDEFCVEHDVQ